MIILLNDGTFGKNLNHLRLKKKISQKKLSQLTGISVYSIRWIEKGRIRDIDASLLECLCNAVGGQMQEMVSEDLCHCAE